MKKELYNGTKHLWQETFFLPLPTCLGEDCVKYPPKNEYLIATNRKEKKIDLNNYKFVEEKTLADFLKRIQILLNDPPAQKCSHCPSCKAHTTLEYSARLGKNRQCSFPSPGGKATQNVTPEVRSKEHL